MLPRLLSISISIAVFQVTAYGQQRTDFDSPAIYTDVADVWSDGVDLVAIASQSGLSLVSRDGAYHSVEGWFDRVTGHGIGRDAIIAAAGPSGILVIREGVARRFARFNDTATDIVVSAEGHVFVATGDEVVVITSDGSIRRHRGMREGMLVRTSAGRVFQASQTSGVHEWSRAGLLRPAFRQREWDEGVRSIDVAGHIFWVATSTTIFRVDTLTNQVEHFDGSAMGSISHIRTDPTSDRALFVVGNADLFRWTPTDATRLGAAPSPEHMVVDARGGQLLSFLDPITPIGHIVFVDGPQPQGGDTSWLETLDSSAAVEEVARKRRTPELSLRLGFGGSRYPDADVGGFAFELTVGVRIPFTSGDKGPLVAIDVGYMRYGGLDANAGEIQLGLGYGSFWMRGYLQSALLLSPDFTNTVAIRSGARLEIVQGLLGVTVAHEVQIGDDPVHGVYVVASIDLMAIFIVVVAAAFSAGVR